MKFSFKIDQTGRMIESFLKNIDLTKIIKIYHTFSIYYEEN